jgi:hypothetical protein
VLKKIAARKLHAGAQVTRTSFSPRATAASPSQTNFRRQWPQQWNERIVVTWNPVEFATEA